MDLATTLVLLKGEDKTADVVSCEPVKGGSAYEVHFARSVTCYRYRAADVVLLDHPEELDADAVRVERQGTVLEGVRRVLRFVPGVSGDEVWWRVWYADGSSRSYPGHDLRVVRLAPAPEAPSAGSRPKPREAPTSRAQGPTPARRPNPLFDYLAELAGLNELKNPQGELMLPKRFASLGGVDPSSALAVYLGLGSGGASHETDEPIYPFGGNESQAQAVREALTHQVSVIQGPPGTGKTQVILTLLANLVAQGKRVIVVSNNNAATENVRLRLAAPDVGLGFLVAPLGSAENKSAFIEAQTGAYPDLSAWRLDSSSLQHVREQVVRLSQEVESIYGLQRELALAEGELASLREEAARFEEAFSVRDLGVGLRARADAPAASDGLLALLVECEEDLDRRGSLSLWLRLRLRFVHHVARWRELRDRPADVVALLRRGFYGARVGELEQQVRDLGRRLAAADERGCRQNLRALSTAYLRAVVCERFGGRGERRVFASEDLWQNGSAVAKEYPIVLSTTYSATTSLRDVTYDYLIMDEASQVDVATGALSLSCARNAVIVGDARQLPPVIGAEKVEEAERIRARREAPGCYSYALSLLESVCQAVPDVPSTLLREHYRCDPSIIGFCNERFYGGELVVMTERDQGGPDPLVLVETAGDHNRRGHRNQRQLDVLVREVLPLLEGTDPAQVGIIAPYRDEVTAAKEAVKDVGDALGKAGFQVEEGGIEVSTVHGFQGREKDVIVLLTVDDVPTAFSDDPHLVNVAVSRARKRLVLVASPQGQSVRSNLGSLAAYVRLHGHKVVKSGVTSVFDLLSERYERARREYLRGHRRVSEFDSENLVQALLEDLLAEHPDHSYAIVAHYPLGLLLASTSGLSEEQRRYATNPLTHLDFLVYDRPSKVPVLAVEVDGVTYHAPGTRQHERDLMKDEVLAHVGIDLVRLATDGSGERERLEQALFG